MDDYIPLSTLNDFIFCPYSIYLHSVYMESDGDLYKAAPQTKGTLAHQGVDEKKGSTRKSDIMSLPVAMSWAYLARLMSINRTSVC